MGSKRNYNLDFFRGIAAIWIVFIHCCFWSGEGYVPKMVQSLSLLIDVPLFIFISGMLFNYSNSIKKTIKSLLKLYFKYFIFIIVYMLIALVINFDCVTFSNFIDCLLFKFNDNMPLSVIGGSIWFLPMYFIVSIICSLFIKYVEDILDYKDKMLLFIFIIFILFIILNFFNTSFILGFREILFYSIIFLFGYWSFNKKINIKKFLLCFFITALLFILLVKTDYYSFDLLQKYKFDFNIVYFLYSLFSIIIVWFINSNMEIPHNIICVVGSNAILFYFCQGISSSIIGVICSKVICAWYLRLFIMFVINLTYTSLFSVFLNGLYKSISFKKQIN